ncbi:MAG: hypothetical protein V4469_02400 [Patescibacteria group bacterium]
MKHELFTKKSRQLQTLIQRWLKQQKIISSNETVVLTTKMARGMHIEIAITSTIDMDALLAMPIDNFVVTYDISNRVAKALKMNGYLLLGQLVRKAQDFYISNVGPPGHAEIQRAIYDLNLQFGLTVKPGPKEKAAIDALPLSLCGSRWTKVFCKAGVNTLSDLAATPTSDLKKHLNLTDHPETGHHPGDDTPEKRVLELFHFLKHFGLRHSEDSEE